MSARLSTGFPRACSGDMYAAVPMTIPISVAAAVNEIVGEALVGLKPCAPYEGSSAFARPKSSTFTVPSVLILMLAGFRSR